MIQKPQSLVDLLYLEEGKAEIVDGEIVRMSPAGGWHGWAGTRIVASLVRHEEEHGGGVALGDNVGFLVDLPRRKSFSPDAAWMPGSVADLTLKFIEGSPSFAVEVRSEGDYVPAAERAIEHKIAEYFDAGSLVVWDVDLLSDDLIKCYRASVPNRVDVFRVGDVADAEPAVPGWRFPVAKLRR